MIFAVRHKTLANLDNFSWEHACPVWTQTSDISALTLPVSCCKPIKWKKKEDFKTISITI